MRGRGFERALVAAKNFVGMNAKKNHFTNLFIREAFGWLGVFYLVQAFVIFVQRFVFGLGSPNIDLSMALASIAAGFGVFRLRSKPSSDKLTIFIVVASLISSYLAFLDSNGELSAVLVLLYAWLALVVYSVFSFREAMFLSSLMVLLYSFGLALGQGFGPGLSTWIPVLVVLAVGGVFVSRVISKLGEFAYLDELTGLPNRRFLILNLTREIKAARRTRTPLTVALIDLDDFKQLNDSKGHVAGDKALAELSVKWSSSLRGRDFVARYGGDEFVVVMPECSKSQADKAIQRILGLTDSISRASYGTAQWDRKSSLENLLMEADRELYANKRSRKGGTSPLDSALGLGSKETIDIV